MYYRIIFNYKQTMWNVQIKTFFTFWKIIPIQFETHKEAVGWINHVGLPNVYRYKYPFAVHDALALENFFPTLEEDEHKQLVTVEARQ